ncbi:MAG: type III-B CRISPR-associated protein Cas10/Cmr2 [Thermoflavifilum sp.]|nr:type III-B CRISPR-associated protein Cas10/Cmr2 [Thermoflavifilum sp.]MCL6515182.1 type III-B CRISPR-associated protein Cas10/Cmr2 [Alicyclobacillus sp.]
MSAYVMIVSLGPVQDFVRAARRTRDLWYGSWMLSELSKAVARAALEMGSDLGAELVFPAPSLLGTDAAVANKLVIRLTHVDEPARLSEFCEVLRETAYGWLRQEARATLKRVRGVIGEQVDEARYFAQVDDFLEFYAVWVPERDTYTSARHRAEQLLAGRKFIRTFAQNEGAWVPKSALDGARETVFKRREGRQPAVWALGIRESETLDAIGLIKRVGSEPRSYPSVVRVAVDPWVRAVKQVACHLVSELKACLDDLCQSWPDLVTRTNPEKWPQYADFPFDGKVLLEGFEQQLEFRALKKADRETAVRLAHILENLRQVAKKAHLPAYPHPYVALLLADGDHMGAVLDQLSSAEEHRRMSESLSRFARAAADVVSYHHGTLVYAGGDDVFALLPVDDALAAAHALRREFEEIVARNVDVAPRPSLSVGIAVGYCRNPLGDLRRAAEQAEYAAKDPDRDGLCVRVETRSGGDALVLRRRWEEEPTEKLEGWIRAIQSRAVPTGVAYELSALLRRLNKLPDVSRDWVYQEVTHILRRKRSGTSTTEGIAPELKQALLDELSQGSPLEGLEGLIQLLRTAKWLAQGTIPRARQGGDNVVPSVVEH